MAQLRFGELLTELDFNDKLKNAAIANVIGRMAQPGSERATWRWLTTQSALGELLEVDFAAMSPMALYRASDRLIAHRETIESALFVAVHTLFGLTTTVTLYDLTTRILRARRRAIPKRPAAAPRKNAATVRW